MERIIGLLGNSRFRDKKPKQDEKNEKIKKMKFFFRKKKLKIFFVKKMDIFNLYLFIFSLNTTFFFVLYKK